MSRAATAALVAGLLALSQSAAALAQATPADRLLAFAKAPRAITAAQAKREVLALFEHMNVPPGMRQRFDPIDQWNVRVSPERGRFGSEERLIVLAGNSVTIEKATAVVVIADGDVEIRSGEAVLVVARGRVRFTQQPDTDFAGIVVTKGRFDAPWVANLFVHAGQGAEITRSSFGVTALNTSVLSSARIQLTELEGKPVFSDSRPRRMASHTGGQPSGLPYAGERCQGRGPAPEEIEKRAREIMPREKCSDVSSAVVTCLKDGREKWRVHTCRNASILEMQVRRVGDRTEIGPYFPHGIPESVSGTVTIVPPPVNQPRDPGGPWVPRTPPPTDPAVYQEVQSLFKAAQGLAAQGERDQAIALYEKILLLDPNRWSAHGNLASLKSARGDLKGAVHHYSQSIEIIGGPPSAYSSRGLVLLRLGDKGRGLADLNTSVELQHDRTNRYNRAIGYFFTGSPEIAIAEFDELRRAGAEMPEMMQLRGWANLALHRAREGCEDAVQSLEMQKRRGVKDNAGRINLGRSLLAINAICGLTGEKERVSVLIDEALPELRPDVWPDSFVLHLRGKIDAAAARKTARIEPHRRDLDALIAIDALQKGRTAEAEKRFKRIVSSSPAYDFARVMSERLAGAPATPASPPRP